jgi:hypothetical protein
MAVGPIRDRDEETILETVTVPDSDWVLPVAAFSEEALL